MPRAGEGIKKRIARSRHDCALALLVCRNDWTQDRDYFEQRIGKCGDHFDRTGLTNERRLVVGLIEPTLGATALRLFAL
jgi:hypothetical protein